MKKYVLVPLLLIQTTLLTNAQADSNWNHKVAVIDTTLYPLETEEAMDITGHHSKTKIQNRSWVVLSIDIDGIEKNIQLLDSIDEYWYAEWVTLYEFKRNPSTGKLGTLLGLLAPLSDRSMGNISIIEQFKMYCTVKLDTNENIIKKQPCYVPLRDLWPGDYALIYEKQKRMAFTFQVVGKKPLKPLIAWDDHWIENKSKTVRFNWASK